MIVGSRISLVLVEIHLVDLSRAVKKLLRGINVDPRGENKIKINKETGPGVDLG